MGGAMGKRVTYKQLIGEDTEGRSAIGNSAASENPFN
jgi:hypothetical protein